MEKMIDKFIELIKNQFEYGGKKYAHNDKKEATDRLFDDFGKGWLFGTMSKYCLRYSNVARERDLLKIACYSEDTEIFTEKGWKLLKDIVENKEKIKVATLNREKNKVEFQYPTNYIKQYRKEKMFHQKNRYLDLLVTQDHNLYIKPLYSKSPFYERDKQNYSLIPAKKAPKVSLYKRDFPYKYKVDKPLKFFTLPKYENISYEKGNYKVTRTKKKKKIPINDWVKFLGIFLAEGYTSNSKTNRSIVGITQSQKVNPKKTKKINNLLNKMGLHPTLNNNKKTGMSNFLMFDMQLWTYLKQFGRSDKKYIPRELLDSLSLEDSKTFLKWLIIGDGYKSRENSFIYTTVSKQLAYDIQELAYKCGYITMQTIKKPKKKNHKKLYTIRIYKTAHSETVVNSGKDMREKIDYDGQVYCVSVPNSTLYVRRKGKPFWCGNCYSFILWLKRGYHIDDLRIAPINTTVEVKSEYFPVYAKKYKEQVLEEGEFEERLNKYHVEIEYSVNEIYEALTKINDKPFHEISEEEILEIASLCFFIWDKDIEEKGGDQDVYNKTDRK